VGRLSTWLKRKKTKAEVPSGPTLAQKFENYKELMAANTAVLSLMEAMQGKLAEGFLFDMSYVRASVEELSSNVGKLVHALIAMTGTTSGGRHRALLDVLPIIEERVRQRLEPPAILPGPLSHRLDAIPAEAFQAGGKAEKLGRLIGRGLPVPPGFVVTAYGQRLFFEKSGLDKKITEELAALKSPDLESLRRAGRHIKQWVLDAPLPNELAAEIYKGAAALGQKRLAVRSSAIHEDSHFSFAGQFETALNVPPGEVCAAYKQVLASQFTPRALYYCAANGFSFEEMGMGVLVMEMIEAKRAGVLYTVEPERPWEGVSLINAVWGLGTLAVGGEVRPDSYRVGPESCLSMEIGDKLRLACCLPSGGVITRETEVALRQTSCLSEAEALSLRAIGDSAQEFFGGPQDIEWAIDAQGKMFLLQSRPLRVKSRPSYVPPQVKDAKVILAKATIASRGSASGRVHLLDGDGPESGTPEGAVPEGAILVARTPSPDYALHARKAAAFICEAGSSTSHLATVLRESGVPGLFGATGAWGLLKNGQEVTVDAFYGHVYEGRVEELLKTPPAQGSVRQRESRQYKALEAVLKDIAPLNLTDPRSQEFAADRCRTYHDITRYVHEMAMRELFEVSPGSHEAKYAKRLLTDIPLEIRVIDLGGGLAPEVAPQATIAAADLRSRPMIAYWRGVTAAGWKGPKPMSLRGFLSVTLSASADTNIRERLEEKNYALLGEGYMNLSNRMGFHFAVIDSYLNTDSDSHVSITFYGGGAEMTRRMRRIDFLARVLRDLDFKVEREHDSLTARADTLPVAALEERLDILGRLMMAAKQLDMVMFSNAVAEHYAREFITGGYRLAI